jgi:SapC
MSAQMLIYENAFPVSSRRHAQWSIEPSGDYAFSAKVNSVPLMAVEFPPAASEYAIVFAGNEQSIMPVVILGMRGNQNVYLNPAGNWDAKYIPAFIRRYPFIFSSDEQGKTLTLCIDEDYKGCNQADRGQRLFDEAGKATPYVDNVLKFLQNYQAQFQRTQAFCQKLQELDLFESMQASITLPGGEKLALTGFMAVDRKKLKALSGDKLSELAQSDELELIYLHLESIRNFAGMRERLTVIAGGKDDEAAPTAERQQAAA